MTLNRAMFEASREAEVNRIMKGIEVDEHGKIIAERTFFYSGDCYLGEYESISGKYSGKMGRG